MEGAEPATDSAVLTSLVEGGGPTSPAIKAVLDRSMSASYETCIRQHIRHHDTMIARLCSAHYQEFIASIDSLVTVKSDVRSLDDRIQQVNHSLQDSGKKLIVVANDLLSWQKTSQALKRAKTMLLTINRALDLIARSQSLIAQSQLMNALKLLKTAELEMNSISSKARIIIVIETTMIPSTFATIKQRVCRDADAWFVEAQAKASQIGAWAIINTEKRVHHEITKEANRRHERMRQFYLMDGDGDRDASTLSSAVCDAVDIDPAGHDEDLFERTAFEFTTIFQAQHIYEALNIPDVFLKYYLDSRVSQLNTLSQYAAPSSSKDLISSMSPFLARLAGFFIIDDFLLKSPNQFETRAVLSSLWETAVSAIKVASSEQLMTMHSSKLMLELKHQIVLFCRSMDQYGFNTTPLIQFMVSHRDKYEELLVAAFRSDLDSILSKEKYEPLTLNTKEEYIKSVLTFGLGPPSSDTKPIEYPVCVAFSMTLPHICRLMGHFIADYFAFATSLGDMYPLIRGCVDDLLIHTVNAKFNSILDSGPTMNVSQAVQLSVNADTMVMACAYWERLIMIHLDPKYYVKPFTLTARILFADTRTRSEDCIFEIIERKIGEMLSLLSGSIDWCAEVSQDGPCDVVQMLVSFLTTTMSCTQYMPSSVRTTVHFASCRSITRILVQLASEAPRINALAIYNLQQDVRYLESYAATTEIPNLDEAFAQLRQLIALFMLPHPAQLLDHHFRTSKFPLLGKTKIMMLLEKYTEVPVRCVLPVGVPRHPKTGILALLGSLRASSP